MEDMLTTKQVAEIKGWTVSYVNRLIRQNRLKAQKLGSIYVIRRGDLDDIKPAARPVGRPRKTKREDLELS